MPAMKPRRERSAPIRRIKAWISGR